jgi:proline iminopeptidase
LQHDGMASIESEHLMEVRGKNLYVETAGSKDLPVLVYLHGGPGASCYDFVAVQMPRLAQYFYVVTFDQRGVLRSDPIDKHEVFGMEDLVADCEALRRLLSISQWNVLGHSFGGHLAVRYAAAHPQSVQTVVLECPSFDLAQSLRSHLRAMGMEWLQKGNTAQSIKAWTAAFRDGSLEDLLATFSALQAEFGRNRWETLHIHGPNKDFFPRLWDNAHLPAGLLGTIRPAFRSSVPREPDQRVARTVTGSHYAAHAPHQGQT